MEYARRLATMVPYLVAWKYMAKFLGQFCKKIGEAVKTAKSLSHFSRKGYVQHYR